MKTGLITSVTLHAVLIGFGLFSLSSPEAYEVEDIAAINVESISLEEFTRIQQGVREKPVAETPAPEPTERTEPVEDAANVGENEVDLDNAPTPDPAPRPVESANAAPSVPETQPAAEPEPEPRSEPEAEQVPVPATELTPEPQPKQDVAPEPAEETSVAENPEAESVKLPDTAPLPEARPQPPRAQTAKAPEHKEAEEPAPERQQASLQDDSEELFEDVDALLNKTEEAGGGAKRSEQTAALGTERDSEAQELSQGEMEALRSQLSGCWNIPVGAENVEGLRASVEFSVDRSGKVEGMPTVVASSGHRQFDESAVRAIQKCDRSGLALPQGKEEVWARIVVNFDPSEMF